MIIKNEKYAKFLYPIGRFATIFWAVTSILKELDTGTLVENLLPLSVQLLSCLLILILIILQSIKMWTRTKNKSESQK